MVQQQITHKIGTSFTGDGQQAQPALDSQGAQLVSGYLPPYARLALEGKVYIIDMSAGTAIAPVVAMPTTSPQWGLYNASSDEHMVVIRASCNLQSGTAGLGLSIVGAAAIGQQTVVAADYSGTVKTRTNGSAGEPPVFLASNPTLVGGTPAWYPFEGTKVNTIATNSVGDTLVAPIDGLLIAAPSGGMVAFEIVGETGTTALFDFMAIIAMVRLR